jgi:hypothetical protein
MSQISLSALAVVACSSLTDPYTMLAGTVRQLRVGSFRNHEKFNIEIVSEAKSLHPMTSGVVSTWVLNFMILSFTTDMVQGSYHCQLSGLNVREYPK